MWTLIFLVLLFLFFSFFSLAPWVPTSSSDYKRANKFIDLKPGESFLEMWCWTAWISLYLAKNNPNSKIVWIELSPFFYIFSKIRAYFSWLKNIEIKYWNALNENLIKYDVIYLFALPKAIKTKLQPLFKNSLNKNFRIISYCFQIDWLWLKEEKLKESENLLSFYKYTKS